MIPILRPTSIREWAEAIIKEYDFYRSLKYGEREAMRLVGLDVEDKFSHMYLSIKQYAADEDESAEAAYERGYNAGYMDAVEAQVEEEIAERA